MSRLFERGRLTDWLLLVLEAELGESVLVGDAVAPLAGGWIEGEPGVSAFRPYTVLTTGPANTNNAPGFRGNISATESWDWRVTYQLDHWGGTRSQVDWTADLVRHTWVTQDEIKRDLGPTRWKLFGWSVLTMGGITRSDLVQPPTYQLTDTVSVLLTFSRA